MPSRAYSEEFKRDAVALYESSPGASIQTIATELGVSRNTLQNWLKKYGIGTRTTSPPPQKRPPLPLSQRQSGSASWNEKTLV